MEGHGNLADKNKRQHWLAGTSVSQFSFGERTELPGAKDPEGTEIEVMAAHADEVRAKAARSF